METALGFTAGLGATGGGALCLGATVGLPGLGGTAGAEDTAFAGDGVAAGVVGAGADVGTFAFETNGDFFGAAEATTTGWRGTETDVDIGLPYPGVIFTVCVAA